VNLLRSHLIAIPIVLPLLAAALLLVIDETRRRLKSLVNLGAALANLIVAAAILQRVDSGGASGEIAVYLASNWEAPFGIVLVADRLSALMLALVGIVSFCAAFYAEAGWTRAGVYFRPLFQIQLMGLNGAFLTGDLFDLFVFFEVMLAASYGLQLHGSGWPRVRSGLHYIAVNLVASALFLVGLAVLYGVVGTLSMADVAVKLALVPPGDRGLMQAGAAILAVAFLIKAAIWPLNAWLVPAYSATSAPVAALFAVMTKVGIYALLRIWTLLFSQDGSPTPHFGQPVFVYGGLATLGFGMLGHMASLRLGRIASFSIIVSSGILLAALGLGSKSVTSAALFYMLSATLAVSALFLLVELIERITAAGPPEPPSYDRAPDEDTNLDDEAVPLIGRAFPISMALLGLAFMACALLVAGLPPLSGFIAKFSLLSAVANLERNAVAGGSSARWLMFALVLLSGLTAMVALARAGIQHFWSTSGRSALHLKSFEAVPVLALILCCVLLTIYAEPVVRFTNATAAGLHDPRLYIAKVSSTKARLGPTRSKREEPAPQ
jgi:multicomponent K+:H+ antiporter subunit D